MTAADYAAIAVAPLLIFFMISSLANFLMLVFYQGPNPLRVAWIVLMFTMGFVGIARIAIEQDRAYSLGYAAVLGVAGFVSMSRFVGSPIFCAFILGVIAYLADRIVDDCTLIDDSVDSSGQGLVDFGKKALNKQIELAKQAQRKEPDESLPDDEAHSDATANSVPSRRSGRGRKSQPGRTVMYLALAALPLFGLGQFILHDDPLSWQRAQWLLAVYLFSSFSLLVTTSFLGLRRYLRQRGVDMPTNVSIGWLAGGVIMTAAIISLAYLVPLPGQAIASVQIPDWFDSPDDFSASKFGWGKEGAATSKEGDATTAEDAKSDSKQTQGMRPEEGAPPGDSGDGKGEDGPPGQQDGGKKSAGDKSSSPSEAESNDDQPTSQSKDGKQEAQQGEQAKSGQKDSQQSKSQQQRPESKVDPSDEQSETPSDQDSADKDQAKQEQDAAKQQPQSDARSSRSSSPPPPASSPNSMLRGWFSTIGSLLKFLLILVLAGIVGAYLWMHREAIARWWNSLFDRGTADEVHENSLSIDVGTSAPPRPFSSFRNPIGREQDPSRVVVITFQAFEAWTREQGWTRQKDETPTEFMHRVAGSLPHMSAAATSVVGAYNRIVYGRGRPTQHDIDAAKSVWQAMSS